MALLQLVVPDFDGDDMISTEDLQNVINRLTGDQKLSDRDMSLLIKNVSSVKPFCCWLIVCSHLLAYKAIYNVSRAYSLVSHGEVLASVGL